MGADASDRGLVHIIRDVHRFADGFFNLEIGQGFDARHATLNAIDQLLEDYQVRFALASNGSDTMAVAVEKRCLWDSLIEQHGRVVNETFCPVVELPDLMNTPIDQIEEACNEFARKYE